MGRHWAGRRGGRVAIPQPVCPLYDLQLRVGEGNQYFAQWNWHGNPDGFTFRIDFEYEEPPWVNISGEFEYPANDPPYATGWFKNDFGTLLRVVGTVAGYPPVVSAEVNDAA